MNTIVKYAAAATLTGALALASAMPSQARDGRNAAAAIGFGAGALVGAAAAGAAYNNGGYYYGDAYAYEPGYVYAPGPTYVVPDDSYAYGPAPSYQYYYPNRWQDEHSTNNFGISSQR